MWWCIHFWYNIKHSSRTFLLLTPSQGSSLLCKWTQCSQKPQLVDRTEPVATWMRGVYLHLFVTSWANQRWRPMREANISALIIVISPVFLKPGLYLLFKQQQQNSDGRSLWPHWIQNGISLPCSLSLAAPLFFLFSFSLSSGFSTQKAKGSEVTITLLHFTWPTQRKAISRQVRKTQTLWNSPGPLI